MNTNSQNVERSMFVYDAEFRLNDWSTYFGSYQTCQFSLIWTFDSFFGYIFVFFLVLISQQDKILDWLEIEKQLCLLGWFDLKIFLSRKLKWTCKSYMEFKKRKIRARRDDGAVFTEQENNNKSVEHTSASARFHSIMCVPSFLFLLRSHTHNFCFFFNFFCLQICIRSMACSISSQIFAWLYVYYFMLCVCMRVFSMRCCRCCW